MQSRRRISGHGSHTGSRTRLILRPRPWNNNLLLLTGLFDALLIVLGLVSHVWAHGATDVRNWLTLVIVAASLSMPVQLLDRITLTDKVLRVRDVSWKRQTVDRTEVAMIVREHDGHAFGLDRRGAVVTRMRPIWSRRQLAKLSAALAVPFEDLLSRR